MIPYIRAAALIAALLAFIIAGIPLMWLAQRLGWRLRHSLPVLFHRTILSLIGIQVTVWGTLRPEKPQMLVVNHISWTDILVFGSLTPVCFLAKSEVAGWPVFGLFARLQGAVFVNRGRRRLIPGVNEQLRARLAAGEVVVLFAEATTGDGTRLLKFHSPHFAALTASAGAGEALLQPAALCYTRRNGLPLDRGGRSDVAWYGDTALAPHLWGLLTGGPIECAVAFAAPAVVTQGLDRKALAAASRTMVRDLHHAMMTGRHLGEPALAYSQIGQKGLHQDEPLLTPPGAAARTA